MNRHRAPFPIGGFPAAGARAAIHPGCPQKDRRSVYPGALAKASLDELNLSVAEAAKTMKITRQQLHNVMRGRSAVALEMALRFKKAFGGSADLWLRMQVVDDLAQARQQQGNTAMRLSSTSGINTNW
jgi:antitoxin HigA-1